MKSELGRELRAAREQQNQSLRAVATAIGISPSLLSQVETGKVLPSVSTLFSLVTYLGVSIDDLLGNTAPPSAPSAGATRTTPVQRREDNPLIEMENGVIWERLAAVGPHGVDPLVVTYAPGASSSVEGRMMRHSGFEYGYLIEGELTMMLDFDRYVLRAGDSFSFESMRPHLYRNETTAPAKGLWFVLGRNGADIALDEPVEEARGIRSAVDVLETIHEALPARSAPLDIGP